MDSFMTTTPTLTPTEFRQLASYIEKNVGIKMPEQKRLMMQSRLVTRLKALHLNTFQEYIDYIFSSKDSDDTELTTMIDTMTTNLTEFFRESAHFDYMTDTVLERYLASGRKTFKVWSAGCSTGQEPYTLSIVLSEFARKHPTAGITYRVLATDVSTKVLSKAKNAVYPMDSIEKLSYDLKKRYFLKSRVADDFLVRVKPILREKVTFRHLNFMADDFGFRDTMQIIFCRNVLIYFDKKTQEAVIRKFMRYLEVGGYLFLGHSETIFEMDLPLKNVAPTVFVKTSN